jgi:methylamine dehydrogenase heavy chain
LSAGGADAADFQSPLPSDTLGQVAVLARAYPTDWFFLDYPVSFSLIDSKIELIDGSASPPLELKGQIGANYYANFLQSTVRPELYVAETFFSRGSRGARTDTITIYDTASLATTGEIVLPGAKRGLFLPQLNSFQFTDNERLALVFNFTPAASVSVVDLVARKLLSEIPIPGCSLIYPTGTRGFSSLCGNGAMLSIELTADGKVARQSETKPFNNLDADPLFSAPAKVGGVSYFVSFKGAVQPIDLSGAEPKLLPTWSLVTADEARANWRPSGTQLAAGGDDGRLYVVMQANGHDGSQRDGGGEVWIFDVATHAKVATIKLKTPTQAINIGSAPHPMLLVASLTGTLDFYDLPGGQLTKSEPTQSPGGLTLIYPVRAMRPAQ